MINTMAVATLKPTYRCSGTASRSNEQCRNKVDAAGAMCGRCSGVVHHSLDPTWQTAEERRRIDLRVDAARLADTIWIAGWDLDSTKGHSFFGDVPHFEEDPAMVGPDGEVPRGWEPSANRTADGDIDPALDQILTDFDASTQHPAQPGNPEDETDEALRRHLKGTSKEKRRFLHDLRRQLMSGGRSSQGLLSGSGGSQGSAGQESDGLFSRLFKLITGSGSR